MESMSNTDFIDNCWVCELLKDNEVNIKPKTKKKNKATQKEREQN